MNPPFVLIVAGEASADLHGANLVRAMKHMEPGILFRGVGGWNMAKAGVDILTPSSEMAVVGLTEVVPKLPTLAATYLNLKRILKKEAPDLLILIDYPDFNIRLSGAAHRFGVPVLYYIGPQVWAWRTGRVKKLRERINRLAVILPFEEDFYRQRGLEAEYVGHPLLDAVPEAPDKPAALRGLGIEDAYPVVGLLPGSRKEEVGRLLPSMSQAAAALKADFPNLNCLLPRASTIPRAFIESILGSAVGEIQIVEGDIYRVLGASDLALVASGTATLEAAMMQTPMVILYKVSPLSFWIGKRVIRVPAIGLPNLVAGKKIVPELIQDEMTAERLVAEARSLLKDGERRRNMIKELTRVREKLGGKSASRRTAQIAVEMLRAHRAIKENLAGLSQ
jgi:lipid-A-disaccharide synthase